MTIVTINIVITAIVIIISTVAFSYKCANEIVIGTGETFTSLQYMYRVGRTTIGEIVIDTCQALIDNLQMDFLKVIKPSVC